MNLAIRSVDVSISDQMRVAAELGASRLDKLAGQATGAKLELRHQSRRSQGDCVIAQVTLHAGKSLIRAEDQDQDAVRAIELAMQKTERQLRRLHERRADSRGPRQTPGEELSAETVDEIDDDERIVRTKRFEVKPIDAEEAIEQMELLGHDFFLFQNLDVNQISLIYRRKDGSYGLLIPEPM